MGQVGMAVRPILETIAPNAIKPSINDLLSLKGLLGHVNGLNDETVCQNSGSLEIE